MPRAALLTYHPIRITENSYAGNDLVALQEDLRAIEAAGIPIKSLAQLISPPTHEDLIWPHETPAVAITFDDGCCLDYLDRLHPTCGVQRSAAHILSDAAARMKCLRSAAPLATSFVIASPTARGQLDRKDYFGDAYWHDEWWSDAVQNGTLAIENHSWDHNHPSIELSVQKDNARGTFANIDTFEEAENEVAAASDYIEQMTGARPKFFAYPWGEHSAYLADEYLPRRGVELGLWAALGGDESAHGFADPGSDRWRVPRLVSGYDWTTPAEFAQLLEELKA